MADMSADQYRQLQSEFVSNLNGTSKLEIMFVVSSAPLSVLLRNCISAFLCINSALPKRWQFVLDFVTLVLTVQMCFTLWSSHIHTALLVITLTAATLMVANQNIRLKKQWPGREQPTAAAKTSSDARVSSLLDLSMVGKRPFISHFRAYVLIATAISILAVDFVIFPRRFCKAETFGTGLMDVGVGAFVISNALVSPEARYKAMNNSSWSQRLVLLMKSVKSCVPLVFLGVARVLAVKSTDYHEHLSEYGLHWNFFFTLAAVKVLSTLVLVVVRVELCAVLGVVIAVLYEYSLQRLELKQFVLGGGQYGDPGRQGLLNANREGVCSVTGYLAIYLTGIQLGRFIFIKRRTVRDWLHALVQLMSVNATLWVTLWLAERNIDPVSRRMANLPYVIWMHCYNMQLIGSFLAVDILWTVFSQVVLRKGATHTDDDRQTYSSFCLLEAVNRNGLLYFLLCNLLTGGVNFSMRTLLASPHSAALVVTLYMTVTCVFMATLHAYDISVKFW